MNHLECFKAYDIRGRVPEELNEDVAYRIGRAYAASINPKNVVVGRDIRLTSASLCAALTKGLTDSGVNVFDIGLCGTEQVYFATFFKGMDGGIMVTASHNPMNYNGMKLVREKSKPISGDTGLHDIKRMVAENRFTQSSCTGSVTALDIRKDYIEHLLQYVADDTLRPLKVVVNAGNGCAGPVLDLLEQHLPFTFIKVNHTPDGTFPNGIPNPLLPENRSATIEAIREHGADVGIAWDGDFDRCFLFDGDGRFIEGYYIVGLLAAAFLKKHPGAKIIHDPRLYWNTVDLIESHGGVPVMSKTGHAFIKERMRAEDAVYGGEMSAHHYFSTFAYCDSGMIPWLLVLEMICASGKSLAELLDERMRLYPASGEINRTVTDAGAMMNLVKERYLAEAREVDYTDGVSLDCGTWRFNLRSSNTEPVLRLNVESMGDQALMERKTTEILALIDGTTP
ncbi:phosphohexomutase domain-containing protein [Geomonas edaphica]|uniref:phosphomannomutase n=1 Tax=Geomonas edaphica TaxID=2570226 RepID=UPI0010A844D6|nr:phosphomannomutase [Geomonas edaphica]